MNAQNKHANSLGKRLSDYICESWSTDAQRDWDEAKLNAFCFVVGFLRSQGVSEAQLKETLEQAIKDWEDYAKSKKPNEH